MLERFLVVKGVEIREKLFSNGKVVLVAEEKLKLQEENLVR